MTAPRRVSPRRIGLVLVVCLAALWSTEARAQVVALRQVPDGIGEPVRARLVKERAELRDTYARLAAEGRGFNGKCASVDRGSAAAAECRRWFADLNARRKSYSAKAVAFNDQVARAIAGRRKALEAELAKLRDRIARHQQALRNQGFETSARQFEGYAARSEEGRREAIKLAVKSAVELSFGAIGEGALRYRTVNPAQSTSLGHRLRAAGVTNPDVLKLVYNMHKIKPREIKQFLAGLKLVTLQAVAGATSHGAAEAAAASGLAVLSYFVKDNAVAHKLALGEFLADGVLLAAGYADVRIGMSRLMRATDAQLEALKGIQGLLKTDMDALIRTKRDLARVSAAR